MNLTQGAELLCVFCKFPISEYQLPDNVSFPLFCSSLDFNYANPYFPEWKIDKIVAIAYIYADMYEETFSVKLWNDDILILENHKSNEKPKPNDHRIFYIDLRNVSLSKHKIRFIEETK